MRASPHWLHVSLRTKLTLLIEALVIILVVVTGIITTVHEKETLEGELYKRGLALAQDLARFSISPLLSNDLATLRRFVNHTLTQDYVLYALILDPRGRVVMHTDLNEVGKVYRDKLALIAGSSQESGCTRLDSKEKQGSMQHLCTHQSFRSPAGNSPVGIFL